MNRVFQTAPATRIHYADSPQMAAKHLEHHPFATSGRYSAPVSGHTRQMDGGAGCAWRPLASTACKGWSGSAGKPRVDFLPGWHGLPCSSIRHKWPFRHSVQRRFGTNGR